MDFDRIFVTGDIHCDVLDLQARLEGVCATERDLVVILGDCGFEFYSFYKEEQASKKDEMRQKWAKENIKPTIFCVQGNHEVPFNQMQGERKQMFGGEVVESNGIIFALNGEVYDINNLSFLVLGGAFSIDKERRLALNYPWWKDEQLSESEKQVIYAKIKGKNFDYVLSHTCPSVYIPLEVLPTGFDLREVDDSMEDFLQKVNDNISYRKWYCGHWHINKKIDDVIFLFKDVLTI